MKKQSRSGTARPRASGPETVPVETVTGSNAPTSRQSPTFTAPGGDPRPDHDSQQRYSEDEIRRRAYELYLQRNGSGGDAEGDWYAAERELDVRRAPNAEMKTV